MAEHFMRLPVGDRQEALAVAAAATGRPIHLLEKDVWVVWSLEILFGTSFAEHLVFKGGTSLSKAYGVIRRFSEDVDITYDIRALAPDLAGAVDEPLPATRSQEKRWTKEIRERLPVWIADQILPTMERALHDQNLSARATAKGEKVFIEYEPVTRRTGYAAPTVQLEFGARSTGEPSETRTIGCDAQAQLPSLAFPMATVRAMRPERTFWEKATAIHVFCAQGEFRGADRFARHWHDISRLDDAGYVDRALADRRLARAVAEHKSAFFRERDRDGVDVDYMAAVSRRLDLVPQGGALEKLAEDYERMLQDGLLLDDAEPFSNLLDRCRAIQAKANALG